MKPYVLITRPLDDAQNLAETIKEAGYTPFVEPMLKIRALEFTLPDLEQYQALTFTSANAVRAVSSHITNFEMPVYCVGAQTEQVARDCGWINVKSADGNVSDLALMLAEEGLDSKVPLLYLAGQDVAAPLIVSGLSIEWLPVYKAEQVQEISLECLSLLDKQEIKAALFFSVRTAQAFVALLESYKRTETVSTIKSLCISDTVVRSLEHLPWLDVQAAQRPNVKALVDLLDKLRMKKDGGYDR